MLPQEVKKLPVGMRQLWHQEFNRLRAEEGWGRRQAEALAWRIFKRGAGSRSEPGRLQEGEEAVWRQRVWGGTPEWLPLLAQAKGAGGSGFLVDRQALRAIMGQWEERGSDLLITLESAAGASPPWPLLPGPGAPVGWLRQLEYRQEGLWGRVEWTEAAMAIIEGADQAVREAKWELVVRYQVDLSRRPVVLQRAGLVLTGVWQRVAGYELGEIGWQ